MKKKCRRNKIIEHEQISKVLCNKQIELFQKKKKNPLTEMSLNLEVNPLTPKNKKNKKIAFSNKIKALQNFCEYYIICAHYNQSTHKFQKSMA